MIQFIEDRTHTSIEKLSKRHSIGAYFRLLVDQIVSNVPYMLYMDTDIVTLANVGQLWKETLLKDDTKKSDDPHLFYLGQQTGCSGLLLLQVSKLREVWQHISTFNLTQWQTKLKLPYGDQFLLRIINTTYPEQVGYIPDPWDVELSFMWEEDNLKPEGAGMLHFNGVRNGNAIRDSKALKEHPTTWGLADYYLRLSWPWAKYLAQSKLEHSHRPTATRILHGVDWAKYKRMKEKL